MIRTDMRLAVFLAVAASRAALAGDPTTDPVRIDHVGLVAPDIIGITLSARHVEYGRQIPYVKQPGDVVSDSDLHRFVRREGKVIGNLVGKNGDLLCTMDEVVGKKLDTTWADDPSSYRIKSRTDSHYRTPVIPAWVHRKSKPADLGMVGPYQFESPMRDVVYLKLPAPVQTGMDYSVIFSDSSFPTQKFTFDPASLRSEAVHVSQIGFRPDEPAKLAFLSCWLGNGGGLHYEPGLPFEIVEASTGRTLFKGVTALSKAAGDKTEDAYNKNYNGTDVFQMDFTGLNRPGKYRVSVKGIGCSYPVEIADDVWQRAFVVAARGFYHQRSGVTLGEPYTTYKRQRPFHPDDGLKVYASKAPLMDTGNGLNQKDSNFGNLVKGKTSDLVTNAWGGYMDAGDWDRRAQHLKASLLLIELAELFPDYFASLSLNLPESGSGLPDIVNEALWGIDFFRRLQLPEGGVRGGIESSEHPRRGEASFQESLTVMTYAPDVLASYMYAGAASRAARWLAARFPERAAVYRESALRAMDWAERDREREEREYLMAKHLGIRDVRNFAAAELFWLTGESKWNSLFLETTPFKNSAGAVEYAWDSLDQADCAWVYARADRPGVDEKVKRNCRDVVLRDADLRVASTEKTGFRWAKHPYTPLLYGGLSSPENAVCVARAHVLSGAPKYLRALVLAAQTGAGANPVNMCYTTGLGQNSPQHPLQLDHRITHQPPPPGLTVGGPMDNMIKELQDPFIGKFAGGVFCPPYKQWPALEAFWDVFWDPMVCEYTIQKPLAGQAYVWGYLAARAKITGAAATDGIPE
jgi:endoglucanase